MDKQQFKFHSTPNEIVNGYSPELENISAKDSTTIRETMVHYIETRGLDVTKRYVAVGNCGDCVIYENGSIDQVSDSG